MSRAVRSFVWLFGLALIFSGLGSGCAHMIENRAINSFAKSLEARDMDKLSKVTSDDFRNRALRTDESIADFKILNIPEGKATVEEVEVLSDDKKRVTVHVGEHKKEVFYQLARGEDGKWVVDDIYLKQKKKGIEAVKSVKEFKDLLETVRETLDSWSGGDREQVLAVATPKLRSALAELPPSFLAQVTKQVTKSKPKSGDFHPQVMMDDKVAVLKLPRLSGETVFTLELRKGQWQVADIGIGSRDEEEKLPSLLNLTLAVNRCVAFLNAYESNDKTKLTELCSLDFYKGSLAFADLKQVKLPEPQLPDHELKVQLRGNRADFTLKSAAEFVQVEMRKPEEALADTPSQFQVCDVTIYEIASKQEKRLSALFTAQGILEVFVDALSRRKIEEVKHCSTADFSNRVWNKMNESIVGTMPLENFESPEMEIVSSSFMGALAKFEVRQDGQQMTYVMTDEGGKFRVDDIQWHMTGLPSSVKNTLEVLIPIQDFASGITLGRDPEAQDDALNLIRRNSSNEFNKMVWKYARFVPNSGMSADTFLQAPLRSMAISDDEVTVNLGDQRYGAKVTLRKEHNRLIVDDVLLIAGPEKSEQLALRQTLRTQFSRGEAKAPQTIMQASHEEEEAPPRRVQQAIHESSSTLGDEAIDDMNSLEDDEPMIGDEPGKLEADPFAEELAPIRE